MLTHKSDRETSVMSLSGCLQAAQGKLPDQTENLVLILAFISSVFIGAAVLWLLMCYVGRSMKQVAEAHCNAKFQVLLYAVCK